MIASSSCSLILVFRMWVSIVVVSVRASFFVFGGSGKDDIVRICCNGVFCFCIIFLEILPNFFVSLTINIKIDGF